RVERLPARMYSQNRESTDRVRQVEVNLAVEAAGSEQGIVQHVGSVGGSQNNHVRARVKAVHFDQNLVERLLALLVSDPHRAAAFASDRVDLVHKDDAR